MKKGIASIDGKEYLGIKGSFNFFYINLTGDDSLIPKSGHIAEILEGKVVGLPTENAIVELPSDVKNLIYVVSEEVYNEVTGDWEDVIEKRCKGYYIFCIDDVCYKHLH
ncbi:MAG: hypothetical protein ACOX0R_02175 [Candidatus Dojkabacteria bacterium]|jgi:hypothetical protein